MKEIKPEAVFAAIFAMLLVVVLLSFRTGSSDALSFPFDKDDPDKTDPYYAAHYEWQELSEAEMLAVCADAVICEADKQFLLSLFNAPAVREQLSLPDHERLPWLPEDDCSRLISRYTKRPSDICRIQVYDSAYAASNATEVVYIEFFETERDKEEYYYPCLYLILKAGKKSDHDTQASADRLPFDLSYRKEIYTYSQKVPHNRMGDYDYRSRFDAAYREYGCHISPTDGTTFYAGEQTLTPMKHRHLYLKYFGWWEALMSV